VGLASWTSLSPFFFFVSPGGTLRVAEGVKRVICPGGQGMGTMQPQKQLEVKLNWTNCMYAKMTRGAKRDEWQNAIKETAWPKWQRQRSDQTKCLGSVLLSS